MDHEEPIEPAADGCPAGWARSPFVDSVHRYTRRRVEGGARVPSPFFDRATWQAQEAVLYLEDEQERWERYRAEVDQRRWRAEADRKERARKSGRH